MKKSKGTSYLVNESARKLHYRWYSEMRKERLRFAKGQVPSTFFSFFNQIDGITGVFDEPRGREIVDNAIEELLYYVKCHYGLHGLSRLPTYIHSYVPVFVRIVDGLKKIKCRNEQAVSG